MPNPYEILGISSDAEEIVIESAYRALAKQYHPDAGGDPEKFKEIQNAYEKIIEGEYLTLALTGLVQDDVSDIVFPYQADEADDTVRWIALFHAYDKSDQLLKWSLSAETAVFR